MKKGDSLCPLGKALQNMKNNLKGRAQKVRELETEVLSLRHEIAKLEALIEKAYDPYSEPGWFSIPDFAW
jgi:chromosome segregation ATPase